MTMDLTGTRLPVIGYLSGVPVRGRLTKRFERHFRQPAYLIEPARAQPLNDPWTSRQYALSDPG